ncbi:MAG: VCBS repeat-containing protein, partial [Myxococcales bacterium]|nr:VCBS repeat-containing protein [Myxococcales bacterium]
FEAPDPPFTFVEVPDVAARGAALVDLDRDGLLDLVADGGRAGVPFRVRVTFNGDGRRGPLPDQDLIAGADFLPEVVDARLADVDGDGWLDVVTVDTDGAIDAYRQVAGADAPPDVFVGPAFEEAVRLAPPCGCVRFVEVLDLNGDAAVDLLAWRRDAASLTVWDRDPAAPLGEAFTPRVLPLGSAPGDVVLHDMDRDGRPDLLLRSGGEVFLRLQDGPR